MTCKFYESKTWFYKRFIFSVSWDAQSDRSWDSLPLVCDALWWFLGEVQQCLNDHKHQHRNVMLFFIHYKKKKQLAAPVRPVGLAVLLHTLGFPLMKQILKRSWEVRRWNWNRFLCSACRDRRIREVWQRLKVKVQTQQNKRINPRNWDQQKQFNSPRKTFTHVSLQGALCTFSVAKVWNDEVTTCHKGARAPRSSL